jgi:hypothetical protein
MREHEKYIKKINRYENLKFKMGLFESKTQTISVNQAANGGSTADVKIQYPLWEIVLLIIIISIAVNLICMWIKSKVRKCFETKVIQVTTANQLANA